ncbi:MAG: catalase [Clostridiales bacterium]|nr:MAG: catalase [Clostridiales bacterium]
MKALRHFKTITHHKFLVLKGCFAVGLYRQGICHDLSKYSWTEFRVGAKYYQGNRSPNNAEREDIGYSTAWLHHKGRNKHHYEYWIDYSIKDVPGGMAPAPMPKKYVAEMLMDRIAASKTYRGAAYTDQDPLNYYLSAKEPPMIHPETKALLETLLQMLARDGEKKTFAYVRREVLCKKRGNVH